MGPYFIDWTSYRADFEREASRILGREVTVEGSARARLIPFPSVTFTDVTVAGETPDEPAMTVEEFSMDAELAPFLRGEVLIFDMRLVRPSAIIEIGEKGTVDWSVRPSTSYDPSQVTLESLTITEGQATVFHRGSGRTHLLREINTQVSARSLAGPWRINGSLRLDGMLTDVSVSTGSADNGAMRVRVEASPERYPLTVEADGRARLDGEAGATYAGTFRLESSSGSGDAQGPDDASDDGPAGNRFSGRFALDHTRLDVPEFRFETGPVEDPYTAEGRAFVEIGAEPRFSITADGAQIRFGETAAGEGIAVAGLAFEERFAAIRDFLLDLPRPTIPGTIEVNLPAIVAGDTTIREIALNAEPSEDGWEIGSLAATLPGRSRFETSGHLATADNALSYSGSLLLAVNQPSGFAAWLAKDIDDAIRRLPAAGFSADVSLTEARQTFENLELILGEARFQGSIDRRRIPNARPSMELSLTGDRLDVEGMTAFASLFVGDDGTNRLADHDVDFEIKAGPVEAGGLTADSVDTALRLRERKLEIDRLTIDGLAGANISATGNISDTESGPAGKIDATVVAVDLAPLVASLAERFPGNPVVAGLDSRARAYPGLLDDAEIGVVASAAENNDGTTGLALSANGVAGGTRFSLGVSGSGPSGAIGRMPFNVTFTARNEEAADLYALYGMPAVPLGLAGSADSELTLEGTLNGGDVSFRFAGEDLEATFEGVAMRDAEHANLQGKARIETGDLEPWLAAAGATLPGFGYGLPAEVAADVRFERGRLAISRIDGSVADVPVAGDLVGRMDDGMPAVTGALELAAFDLALPAAMIVGDTVLGGTAEQWPSEPFRSEANAWFAADVEVAAGTLFAGPAVSMGDASLQLEIGSEGLSITQFSGKHGDAEVSGFAELKNNAGTGLLSGQIQLAGADLASSFPVEGLSGFGDISVSLSASGKSVSGMVAGLSGSGSMSVREFAIEGINPGAFSPLIEQANAIGPEIDAGDTVDFAPDIVRSGRFEAGEAEAAIAIAGGVMRTPPLRLEDEGTVMTVEARADLNAMTASAEGSVTYDPGLEAVAGSEPTVRFAVRGPIGGLKTSLETEPLAQYLTQRALEREQARVEHMQAVLLEKQRLRRESQYYAALRDAREEARAERRRHEREVERLRREAEEKARAEEERRQAEEEERRRQAEEERLRQQQAEEEERRQRQAAEEEEQRRQAEGREQQQEQQQSGGASQVPDVRSGETIERAPLPPPRPRDRPGQAAAAEPPAAEPESPDEVRNLFRPENLTVEGLMDIIRPRR